MLLKVAKFFHEMFTAKGGSAFSHFIICFFVLCLIDSMIIGWKKKPNPDWSSETKEIEEKKTAIFELLLSTVSVMLFIHFTIRMGLGVMVYLLFSMLIIAYLIFWLWICWILAAAIDDFGKAFKIKAMEDVRDIIMDLSFFWIALIAYNNETSSLLSPRADAIVVKIRRIIIPFLLILKKILPLLFLVVLFVLWTYFEIKMYLQEGFIDTGSIIFYVIWWSFAIVGYIVCYKKKHK